MTRATYTCACGATWDWWDYDGYRPGWTLTDEDRCIGTCPACDRDLPTHPDQTECTNCEGNGCLVVPVLQDTFGNWDTAEVTCAPCDGTGFAPAMEEAA